MVSRAREISALHARTENAVAGYVGSIATCCRRHDSDTGARVAIEANDPDPEMPTGKQKESVFRLTKSFLDGYYSSLSQLCAVLNEFSNAFGTHFASKRNRGESLTGGGSITS